MIVKPLTAERLRNIDERISVMEAEGHGIGGGLWTNLARAYKYAVENFEFDVLLRIDTDALIIAKTSRKMKRLKYLNKILPLACLDHIKLIVMEMSAASRSTSSLRKESGIRGILNLKRRKTFTRLD